MAYVPRCGGFRRPAWAGSSADGPRESFSYGDGFRSRRISRISLGSLSSINGRDRTDWDGAVAAEKLQTDLTTHPDIKGIYMQSSFALSGTLQVLKQQGQLGDPKGKPHVFVVSNDGAPGELTHISKSSIGATVSQPVDLYAKYYLKAAIDGKTFRPGKTDHESTVVRVRDGLLEDQLSAPSSLLTAARTAASLASRAPTRLCGATASADAGGRPS